MDQKTPSLVGSIRLNGNIIGQGAYAVVKEGYKSAEVMCAVKMFHPTLLDATKGKKYCKNMFEYEASVMAILDHPNIVQFFGVYYEGDCTDNPPWLVMERLHTSLRSLINEQKPQPHIKVNILCDVAAGLEYLHSPSLGIVHCDLTPNNILISESLKAKIGDFGNSGFLDNGTLTTQTPGTALYMAPEARQTISSYNEKLDIYSFGWVVVFTFTGKDPDEASYYRFEKREDQILQLQKPLQKLIAQCLHGEPQERPNASEVATQLHNIVKSDVQHTDNLLLSSASAAQSISNASLTGPIHLSHPALWAYSMNPLMSHCNSAPAGFASGDLPRKYEFLHNRSQFSRNSHDSSLTSSTLGLSVSPSVTGSRAGPELAKCSGGHTNLDVQRMARKASSLTELFCSISKCHATKEFSSVTDLQRKSWSMAPVKFVYISADSSLYTDEDYEIETRYKFDNTTASHFCREMKTKIPNTIDLSQLKGSEFTIMLHKERSVRIGVLHIEAVRQSNQSISRLIATSSADELKLNDYMALLLWISLLQLRWLLYCVCLLKKRPLVCPPSKKEYKVEYCHMMKDTCSLVVIDTTHGIIMPANSNCVHSTNLSCTNLPCINELCTCELTLAMHLRNIKAAVFPCINNLLRQGACNYDNEMQVTELEKRNICYHAYICVHKADHCNNDRMLSSGTTAASSVEVQTLTVVEPGDPLCKTVPVFEPPIRCGLYLKTSKAKKHFSNPIVENIHQAQLTTIANVQHLPKVNMLVHQGTSQPNVSDTYTSYLLNSLPNNQYLAIQHPNSRLNNRVTSSARWAAGVPKVLLYCNNIRKLVFEFHIGVGDVCVALQLNSTFLFSQLAKSNQLLNHGSLMLHHTLYDNMIDDVVQQCLSMYYITTLNNKVCQEEHVAMTMPPVFQFIMKQLLERFKVPLCEAKPSVEILKAELICSSYVYISSNLFHNEGNHHSVPKEMKTQLTATCHYVNVLLGKQHAGQLISSAHLLGIPLHNAQAFHCRVDVDGPVQLCVTADLPSAGTMDKLHSCCDNKKKTAGAAGCLVADDICLAIQLNGTCLYNQGLVKTVWLLREHLSYTLYSNTSSCVVQQFTPMCLTINIPSNDDKSAVIAVSQASVSEIGYNVTTKVCSALEGNLLAVTVNDHLRNQIKSKVLNQVSIAILHTSTPSGFYCGYTTNLSIAYSPVVFGNQYMCHDKVLVHLFGLQNTEIPFAKITSVSYNNGCAVNRVLSEPYQNKYLKQPNKVPLTDQLTLIQSVSTRAEGCTQLEPLVSLPDAKMNSSSVCVGQHFYCCDPHYCSLVDQIVTIKSGTLDLTIQLLSYRAWTMYLHMWYWKTIQFPTSVHLITDSSDRLTTILSGKGLSCKEKVKLFFDKLIPSCKNSPASRFMHSKLINRPSTTTASILTRETEFSVNFVGKFNSSLLPNIQGSRWHCGKTCLLSFSNHPNALPNTYVFSQQFSIPWIIAHMQAVNYPRRNYKLHDMLLLSVQKNLEHRCNREVVLSPDIAANVPLETFMHLDDRNNIVAKVYAADDVIQQATSINAVLLDQFVKSTQPYGKYLLLSCEVEVVQHFILLHLLASNVKLLISTLCLKTLDLFFEYSNDTLDAGMFSVTTSLRFECHDISPVDLTVATQPFRDLEYPTSLVNDSQVINEVKCAVWFAEVSKPCTSSHLVHNLSNINLSTYDSLKQSTLILLTQFLSQGIFPVTLLSNLLDSGQMITLDATFYSRTVFYKIVYILVYHEFVKNSVQDIYKNTSKQYSFMLSVSFVPEFTSDLQVFVTMHMMLEDHSVAGNKVSMYLSSLIISNVISCPHTNSREIISKALTEHTIAAQLVGHQLTTLNYTRWSFVACDDEHNIQPHALILMLDMVSQESLFDRNTTTVVLSHIDNLVHGHSKKVSHLPNVIVGTYVDIDTYQHNQFVNIKHLVDKWSLISHHRLCNNPLIDVVQQLLLCFNTLLSDKVVVKIVGQIDDTDVTLKMPLQRHKRTIPPCNTECSEHHLNSSTEHLVYTTISIQLSGYPVSSKNVNFLIVTAMNIIKSSGVSFHAFTCVYSNVYSNNHMSGDALAVMNTPHYSQSRKELQQSTEIDSSTTMVFNLQGHNDTCELPVIFSSRDSEFKVGNNKRVMTQHFVVTHDLFDKQQMCFAIFLSSIVYPHFSYKIILSIITTLEFNPILHNRKLHPVTPSGHYIYNLVAAQCISLKYSMSVTECFLAVRWSKIILDGPLENPAEAKLNYYGLKLVIDQQRSNCPCVNVSVNSFPSIWHKFVLNSQSFVKSSFHPMEYLRMHYYVQELPLEQTLACVTCSTEMVIATPPLNLLLGNNPADFRGHVSGNSYVPLSVVNMLSGFISLPPITSCANTQKLVHCDLLHHLVNRDKKTFDQLLCPKTFKTLLFNNHQLEAKQPQQDNLHIQQDMETTREKQALLKVNNTGNGYGRQHNNNNGSTNSNSNHANGMGNGENQGEGNRGESQREGNSGGGGRGQGTGSGSGDEGRSGGSGNHGSGNSSRRSGNNEIPQGSENTPLVLQPEVNHTDRQPTIYRPLASPYTGDSNYHSSDFHVTSDNTTLWDFPKWQHPVEETNVNGRSVLALGIALQKTPVSYHPQVEETNVNRRSLLVIGIASQKTPVSYHPQVEETNVNRRSLLVIGIALQKTPVSYHPHVEETNVNRRSLLVIGIASQKTPVSYHPHVEETNVNQRSLLVIGIASQKTPVSYHPQYPLTTEESTPDDSEGASKLAITLNLHYSPQHLPLKKSVLPSNHKLSQNNNNVIHISTIQTYMFQSENPVPHHDTYINTHPPFLQVVSENIISIDTTTLLTGPIHEVGEQYIPVLQVSCPAEVSYLKSPKQFYAMLGTGGNTQRTVFQESDIISKSLPGPIQAYQNYIKANSEICGVVNLCATIKNEASCCVIEMNGREVHCEQLCLVSLAPEGGEAVLLAPEGGGI